MGKGERRRKRGEGYGGFQERKKGNSRGEGNEMSPESLCELPFVNV